MLLDAKSAATRIAFLMALESERPWQMMQTPLTPKQRRAAEFGIIDSLLEIVVGRSRKRIADLAGQRGFERFAQHAANHLDQAFADLQRHVADETVAHDHVDAGRRR